MTNRKYANLALLRKDVNSLIDQHRYRFTRHAAVDHAEIPQATKLAVVRWGANDKPDQDMTRGQKYICWARTPQHGLCRASYAVIETDTNGALVLVISVFPE
jgi:hypothetical protein